MSPRSHFRFFGIAGLLLLGTLLAFSGPFAARAQAPATPASQASTAAPTGQAQTQSQSVDWQDLRFSEALAQAKAQNRPLLVDVYATWCGPCHELDRKVFNQRIVALATAPLIAVKVNGELGEGPDVAQRYHVVGYPTVLILDPDGVEIDRVFGFVEASTFAETVTAYLNGKSTLEVAAREALLHPDNLQAALEVGTRFAVRGNETESLRHFGRIFEARLAASLSTHRATAVARDLALLTGTPRHKALAGILEKDLASSRDMATLDSLSAKAYLIIGKYLYLRGRKDFRRAQRVLTALRRSFPKQPEAKEAVYHLAVAEQRSGKSARARKGLAAYLKSEKGSPAAANTVAWFCYRERAHLPWGELIAKRALKSAPNNAALWDTLAELMGAQNNWEEALQAEQKAAVNDPAEPYYQEQIERFKEAVKRAGEG